MQKEKVSPGENFVRETTEETLDGVAKCYGSTLVETNRDHRKGLPLRNVPNASFPKIQLLIRLDVSFLRRLSGISNSFETVPLNCR